MWVCFLQLLLFSPISSVEGTISVQKSIAILVGTNSKASADVVPFKAYFARSLSHCVNLCTANKCQSFNFHMKHSNYCSLYTEPLCGEESYQLEDGDEGQNHYSMKTILQGGNSRAEVSEWMQECWPRAIADEPAATTTTIPETVRPSTSTLATTTIPETSTTSPRTTTSTLATTTTTPPVTSTTAPRITTSTPVITTTTSPATSTTAPRTTTSTTAVTTSTAPTTTSTSLATTTTTPATTTTTPATTTTTPATTTTLGTTTTEYNPCPSGYFYIAAIEFCFGPKKVTGFEDYKNKCRNDGAQLAFLKEIGVVGSFVDYLLNKKFPNDFYMGLTYDPQRTPDSVKHNWKFVDLDKVYIGGWTAAWFGGAGPQDLYSDDKQCVIMETATDFKFQLAPCDNVDMYAMCLKSLSGISGGM